MCVSVRVSTWNNSAPTVRILIKIDIIYMHKYPEKISDDHNDHDDNHYK
jgi:hypothetical protein